MSDLFGNMFEENQPAAPRHRQQDQRHSQPATQRNDYNRGPYTMPFGKHKGTPIMDLPVDYLIWLWFKRDGDPLRDPLACCVRKALESYNIDPEGECPEQSNSR